MLVINSNQIKTFENAMLDSFINRSIIFLRKKHPSFTKQKSDDDIKRFIRKIISLSKKNKIKKERNIMKIMTLKIKYNFKIPFSENKNNVLYKDSFSEDYHVYTFEKSLTSNSRVLKITLEEKI